MSDKSQAIINLLNTLSSEFFGNTRSDALSEGVCVSCEGDATSFRDAISEKEYGISGFCQTCQDDIFGE